MLPFDEVTSSSSVSSVSAVFGAGFKVLSLHIETCRMNIGNIRSLFWVLAANRQHVREGAPNGKVQQVHRLEMLHLVSSEWHKWTRNCSVSSLPFAG